MNDEPIDSDSPAVPFVVWLCRATALSLAAGVFGLFGMVINREIGIVTGGLFGLIAIILGVMIRCRNDAHQPERRSANRGVAYGLLLLLGIWFFGTGTFGPRRVREPAARSQSTNNLKQIGIATHSFHDAQNDGPADDEIKDKD